MRTLAFLALAACSAAGADPKPALTIANGKPGAFTLTANEAVKLKTVASIERKDDKGKWADISKGFDVGVGYRLIAACTDKAPECVSIAAGGTLSPEPWTGYTCSSQCNGDCDKNGRYGEGDYRLVVTSCDGKATFTGPVFHMPKN